MLTASPLQKRFESHSLPLRTIVPVLSAFLSSLSQLNMLIEPCLEGIPVVSAFVVRLRHAHACVKIDAVCLSYSRRAEATHVG